MLIRCLSLAALAAAACGSHDNGMIATTGGLGADAHVVADAREWHDAKTYEDAHEVHDAHVYEDAHVFFDAHEFHDAHVYMDAPAAPTCVNKLRFLSGTMGARTETLNVDFDCGGYAPEAGTAVLAPANGHAPISHTFACGNNVLMFPAEEVYTVNEIIAVDFDVTCTALP